MKWILGFLEKLMRSGVYLQRAISGYIPVLIALTLYLVIARVLKKKHSVGNILLTCVFAFYHVGIVTMTGIWERNALSNCRYYGQE